ncbi:MAG TPA: hypothetical protein VFN67_29910 [Polyangiales bacterium]|nr:hypothetical protein [Polyangiales bacterium]
MKECRVAVGAHGSQRSTIWKFSCHKADAYITSRMFGGDGKVSFHESGQCQWSLTGEWVKRTNSSNQERHFAKWSMQRPGGTEAPLIFRIVIPSSELEAAEPEESFDGRVTWLPDPGAGNAVVLHCYMTPPTDQSRLTTPPDTLCALLLSDGRFFVVTNSVVACPFDVDVERAKCIDVLSPQGLVARPGNRLSGFFSNGDAPGLLEMAALPAGHVHNAMP